MQDINILKQYYENIADKYDAVTQTKEAAWVSPQKVNQHIKEFIKPGIFGLDLGVGTGQSIELLYERGVNITGLDLSPNMISITEKRFSEGYFLEANIEEKWPEFEQKFDLITASGVLEFISDINFVISNVANNLKAGGIFCCTYEKFLPEDRLQKFKQAELAKGLSNHIPRELSFFVYRYDEQEFKSLIESKGLSILETEDFNAYNKKSGAFPVTYQLVLAQKL